MLETALNAISSLTDDELRQLNHACVTHLKMRTRAANAQAFFNFKLGDKVKIHAPHSPLYNNIEGSVVEILRTKIVVNTTLRGRVRAPASSLVSI